MVEEIKLDTEAINKAREDIVKFFMDHLDSIELFFLTDQKESLTRGKFLELRSKYDTLLETLGYLPANERNCIHINQRIDNLE